MKASIKQYKKAVEEIVKEFDSIHGTNSEIQNLFIVFIADMYVRVEDIIYCLEHDLTFDTLYEWYNDLVNTGSNVSLHEFCQKSFKK